MESIGLVCLALILCYSAYPSRVRKLEHKINKLKSGGEKSEMSKLISELVGKRCTITSENELTQIKGEVTDVDGDWVKIVIYYKKGNTKTKIIRIDSIKEIEINE